MTIPTAIIPARFEAEAGETLPCFLHPSLFLPASFFFPFSRLAFKGVLLRGARSQRPARFLLASRERALGEKHAGWNGSAPLSRRFARACGEGEGRGWRERGGGGRGLGASCLFVPPPLKRTMFQSHVYLCPSETVFFSHSFRPLLLLLLAHARIALSSQKPSSRESCCPSGSFCRNRGEEEKGEFLSLSFFLSSSPPPLPPPTPFFSLSEKTIQNLWSVFCISCCHWHADESMGAQIQWPHRSEMFFSLVFVFFRDLR